MSDASSASPKAAASPRRTPDGIVRRVISNRTGLAACIFIAAIVLMGFIAPFISPYDPNHSSFDLVLAPPSAEHLLGGDGSGRDVLSRLFYATRTSLAATVVALVVALLLGVSGGLIAAYFGGWFDAAASWVTGLIMALPGIVVLLAARAVLGPSVWTSMVIFGILISPAFFRLVYASVRAVKNELYVDAARVAGLSNTRIIGRHVLTVIRGPIIVQSAMVSCIVIAVLAGLEFLGLGDRTVPTWGGMLNDGFQNMFLQPVLMLWPGLMIATTSVALTLLANVLRDELEQTGDRPRRRNKRAPVEEGFSAPSSGLATSHISQEESEDALLEVRDLSVGYPQSNNSTKVVVAGVSLYVRRGEILGLIGESGSGKTQTAFSILDLLPQGGEVLAGSIRFDGEELVRATGRPMEKIRGRRVAYVPQEPMSNLDPAFTVGSQLVEPLRVHLDISAKQARSRAIELLERVGIPDPARVYRSYPHEISGGMAQRVLIAGAISCDPELIVADEPTTALDVTVQAEVLDLLRDLQKEWNMGMVLVTHNFGVVADLCDRVSVMQDGSIVESGSVRQILREPQHAYTRELIDAILEGGPSRREIDQRTAVER